MKFGARSRYNPSEGIADFWNEIRRPTPYRWPIWGLSALSSFGLMYYVITEEVLSPPERPKVAFIKTFAAGRTDAEIIASNIENQKRKERLAAEQAERDEAVKDMYRKLGRATGIDVDAMERKIAREKAAEEAARAKMKAPVAGASGATGPAGGAVAPAAE